MVEHPTDPVGELERDAGEGHGKMAVRNSLLSATRRRRRRALLVAGAVTTVVGGLGLAVNASIGLARDDSAVRGTTKSSSSWEFAPQAPLSPRQAETVVHVGEQLVVWGGNLPERPEVRNDGAYYDINERRWDRLPASPIVGRTQAVGIANGRRVAVVGGFNEGREELQSGAIVSLDAGVWDVLPDSPIGGHLVGAWNQSGLLVASAGQHTMAVFDPGTNTWREPVVTDEPIAAAFRRDDESLEVVTVSHKPGESLVHWWRYDVGMNDLVPIDSFTIIGEWVGDVIDVAASPSGGLVLATQSGRVFVNERQVGELTVCSGWLSLHASASNVLVRECDGAMHWLTGDDLRPLPNAPLGPGTPALIGGGPEWAVVLSLGYPKGTPSYEDGIPAFTAVWALTTP